MRKIRIVLGMILLLIGAWLIVPEKQYDEIQAQAKAQSNIPTLVKEAIISSEDSRFYYHVGVDPIAILRAFKHNITTDGDMHGGSTITQQLVKNQMLSSERTLERKLIELVYSIKVDFILSKNDIINFYGNSVYFGEGAYGIDAASKIYFNKSPDLLTLSEATTLVGILPAPSIYTPSKNFHHTKTRQKYVLDRMVQRGFISEAEAIEAFNQPLHFSVPVATPYPEKIPTWTKETTINIEKAKVMRLGFHIANYLYP